MLTTVLPRQLGREKSGPSPLKSCPVLPSEPGGFMLPTSPQSFKHALLDQPGRTALEAVTKDALFRDL
jgi:hypothetical protein